MNRLPCPIEFYALLPVSFSLMVMRHEARHVVLIRALCRPFLPKTAPSHSSDKAMHVQVSFHPALCSLPRRIRERIPRHGDGFVTLCLHVQRLGSQHFNREPVWSCCNVVRRTMVQGATPQEPNKHFERYGGGKEIAMTRYKSPKGTRASRQRS